MLAVGSSLLAQPASTQAAAKYAAIDPAQQFHVDERLARYKVPGISIAVIDHNRILWTKGFGKRSSDGLRVNEHTLFQAGSLSKPVSAAVAILAARQRKASLDSPINSLLKSWQLPDGAGPANAVTLRRLLSHSAGINIHGFRGYSAGETLPTLDQVLAGAAPANSPAIAIESVPGAGIDYSGGGYVIVQKAVEDLMRRPFASVAAKGVFEAAGMRDSVYATSLPARAEGNAAQGFRADGQPLPGGWNRFVELAPAGLWSTPTDLARFAIWLSRPGNPVGREMLTPQKSLAGQLLSTPGGSVGGVGVLLDGSGPAFRFSHAGANPGQKAYIVYFPGTGQGAVIMANGDAAPRLMQELLTDFASAYHWPDPMLPKGRAPDAARPATSR
jgi:CubicO group peptidase (beta-lactamase class C family)